MTALSTPRPLSAVDDLQDFDCGRDSLNHWFRRTAWRNQQSGASRVSVVCRGARVAGFVSLSAAQIERAYWPKPAQRNLPDPLPAILLGRLAVDRSFQRLGVARTLMLYALTTSLRLSKDLGCFCVLTHPIDDDVRGFYRAFGFDDLPGDPERSMAVRIVDLERSGL